MIHGGIPFSCRIDMVFFISMMNFVYCRCGFVGKDLLLSVACDTFCVNPSLNIALLSCCVFCVMDVKQHSYLGGKRCLGEGVSSAHTYS